MQIIQIVPTLPPAISGVGDYATLLAGELVTQHGVGSRFVVTDLAWDGKDDRATKVTAHSAGALVEALSGKGMVLLHYVPYGYAHRGCPFWLVDGLERWKRANSNARLIVIFHEVYASGPPWSSVFWTSPFQRHLAARLARLADARRITTEISLRELRGVMRRSERDLPTVVAPVFSNVGELQNPRPLAERVRRMVVFGSRIWRAQVYVNSEVLAGFCEKNGIDEIVDVGARLATDPLLGNVGVRVAGTLPAAEAGALFAGSVAGYFNYPSVHLGKSGIFAAYCAHGLAPVTFATNRDTGDGLRAGEHYVAGMLEHGATLESVASAAHAWYGRHSLAVHAREVAELARQ